MLLAVVNEVEMAIGMDQIVTLHFVIETNDVQVKVINFDYAVD